MNGAQFQRPAGGGFGLSGPVPRDVVALLATIVATFSLQYFASTETFHGLLLLTPAVWGSGFLWQVATYPFAGVGAPNIWFLLELGILFLFVRTVYFQLGRRGFWRWMLTVCVLSGLLAVVVDVFASAISGPGAGTFSLMQGQHMLLTVTIAAFATMNRDATILLFFVLPVQAKWFLLLELLFAFMGFLGSRDLAGFVGLCAGIGLTFVYLSSGSLMSHLRRGWLKVQEQWIGWRLKSMRRRRKMRIVKDESSDDEPWVN